jgi:Tfp pilus assembly protein PilF
MGRVISIIGLLLIVGAGVLASVSTTYEEQLQAKKEIVAKYVKSAKEAIDSGDKKEAIKFIKKAIKVDPDSKEPFKLLEKIYTSSAQPTATQSNQNTQKTEATKAEVKPTQEEKPTAGEEEEEDLGC